MNSMENITEKTKNTNLDDFKHYLSKLSQEDLLVAIESIKDDLTSDALQKLTFILKKLEEPKLLEAVGGTLSLKPLLFLLNAIHKEDLQHWKLSPILVGVPHQVFSQILSYASETQLNTLKQEAFTEALQHHLTLMTHEMVQQVPNLMTQIDQLEKEISDLKIDEISSSKITFLTSQIQQNANLYQSIVEKINKLLILTWNTDRTDLIEKLSTSKELIYKLVSSRIGHSKTYEVASTGLYAYLENRLNQVFNGFKVQNDIEVLDDDEPSMEALVNFSLWYLRDYWEIGLLPNVDNPLDLEREENPNSDTLQANFRENLYKTVHANLEKLNLKTVGDLKKNHIFSKTTLIEYINQNRSLLD